MASAGGIRAGKAYIEFWSQDAPLRAGLRKIEGNMKAFGASIGGIGSKVLGAGLGIAAIKAPFLAFFSETGSAIAHMAERTGITIEALSQLGFAASQSGIDLEELETGIKKMQKAITTGEETIGAMGLSLASLKGMTPDKQLEAFADKFAQIKDPAQRTTAALAIFGKAGTKLLPMLDQGAKGLQAMREEADAAGQTIGGESAENALRLHKAMAKLWATIKMTAFQIGAALAPAMIELLAVGTKYTSMVVTWIKDHKDLVVTTFAAATSFAGLLIGIGAVLKVVGLIAIGIGALAQVFSFLLSPLGLLTFAIVGIGLVLWKMGVITDTVIPWMKETFGGLLATFKEVWGGIVAAIGAGDLQGAANIAWAGLKVSWLTGKNWLITTWSSMWGTILDAFDSVSLDLAIGANVLWTKIRLAFTSGAGAAWKAYDDFTTNIGRGFIEIGAKIGLITEDERRGLQEAMNAGADNGAIGRDTEAKRKQIQEEGKAMDAALRAGQSAPRTAAENDPGRAERDKGIVDARKELADALDAAKKAQEDAKAAIAGRVGPVGDGTDLATKTLSSTGSFSAAAISASAGTDIAKRQLDQLEMIAASNKRMEQQGRGVGPVFA